MWPQRFTSLCGVVGTRAYTNACIDNQEVKMGLILLWLLGIPIPLLLLIALLA